MVPLLLSKGSLTPGWNILSLYVLQINKNLNYTTKGSIYTSSGMLWHCWWNHSLHHPHLGRSPKMLWFLFHISLHVQYTLKVLTDFTLVRPNHWCFYGCRNFVGMYGGGACYRWHNAMDVKVVKWGLQLWPTCTETSEWLWPWMPGDTGHAGLPTGVIHVRLSSTEVNIMLLRSVDQSGQLIFGFEINKIQQFRI